MALTLSDYRSRLRRKLEDTSGSPLWLDTLLNDALRNALDQYSGYARQEKSTTLTLGASAASAALPADCRDVVAVIGPDGWRYPPATAGWRYTADLEAAWERFGDTLYFTAPMPAGDYTLWYRADYVFPAADGDAWPGVDADAGWVVAMAVVYALTERTVQEWKRGPLPARYAFVLQQARDELKREEASRRRVVRVGSLGG